jgi:uncharacterized protein
MSETITAPVEARPEMTPVQLKERVEVVDVLRGFALIGVLMMNMTDFAGYHAPLEMMGGISRIVLIFIMAFAQAKFYTIFSFLFGWGMSIQMRRAEQRGKRFAPLYVRRLLALLLIGLVHGILIWDGDILAIYAMLGFFLLLFRKSSDRTILLTVAIFLLIPVLISTPGPGETFREAYNELGDSWLQDLIAGYEANVHTEGTYWEAVVHRFHAVRFGYSRAAYWVTHVLAMFLLGLYVGRRKIFENVSQNLPFVRKVMWVGLIVGGFFNAIFVYATTSQNSIIPEQYVQLATRGARTVGSSILCLGYMAVIVLLFQHKEWKERLIPLAAVGRMPLTNYLTHSVVCTLVFYGYGLGLYGGLSPAITIILTFAIYRAQVWISSWWLARYRFGPAEWLWRSLTYGRLQPMSVSLEVRDRYERRQELLSNGRGNGHVVSRSIRRISFLLLLIPALVFFITLAMSMGRAGGWAALLDTLPFASDSTEEYLVNLAHGDMGAIAPAYASAPDAPVSAELARALPRSLGLLAVSLLLAVVIGLPLGIGAGLRRKTRFSGALVFLSVLGISTPSYFAAMLLIWSGVWLYRTTGSDFLPLHGFGWDAHLILPALVLAARPAANVMRLGYNALVEVLDADFVRTAHAKGLGPRVVLLRHVLRNAGVPLITTVAVSLRFSLAILPIVEYIFNWSGVGEELLAAIQAHDVNTVIGMVLPLALIFVVVNVFLEIVYVIIDPRLRTQEAGAV